MDNYQYIDRKMMKWAPFSALLEHNTYINDLIHNIEKIEKPILSEDQFYILNYKLDEAYSYNNKITIKYYNHGYIKRVEGIVTGIDIYNKLIYIGNIHLNVINILDIY